MKNIQEKQPLYWGRKSEKLTRPIRLEEEKLETDFAQPNLKGNSRRRILIVAH
jgi:hypothetical protein